MKTLARTGLGILAVLFVYFVWPTPWRYDRVGGESLSYPVRINRLTGAAQRLHPLSMEWIPERPPAVMSGHIEWDEPHQGPSNAPDIFDRLDGNKNTRRPAKNPPP